MADTRKQIQERQQAMLDLDAFNKFLRSHGQSRSRTGLSPSKALEHLKDPNVRELLTDTELDRYRKACEVLR